MKRRPGPPRPARPATRVDAAGRPREAIPTAADTVGMLSTVMPLPAIRVTFVNDEAAYRRWAAFGDSIGSHVSSLSRKRDGASYVLLLRDTSVSQAQQVAEWCRQQADVVCVARIAESEFWGASSNAV